MYLHTILFIIFILGTYVVTASVVRLLTASFALLNNFFLRFTVECNTRFTEFHVSLGINFSRSASLLCFFWAGVGVRCCCCTLMGFGSFVHVDNILGIWGIREMLLGNLTWACGQLEYRSSKYQNNNYKDTSSWSSLASSSITNVNERIILIENSPN